MATTWHLARKHLPQILRENYHQDIENEAVLNL